MSKMRPGNILIAAFQNWALMMIVFVLCLPWIFDVIYWLVYGLIWVLTWGDVK